tara:strand:+ start:8385 stop:8588 length:204 start_codon:yes stop_codon:yes gene_type:complete
MNRYKLRVFPGNQIYLETITAQGYTSDKFKTVFFNLDKDNKKITVSVYPTSVVIIESIQYDIKEDTI